MNNEIQKAFEYMISHKPISFSEKGISEIEKHFGLENKVWIIRYIDYDSEIQIESDSHFQYSGLGIDMFDFK